MILKETLIGYHGTTKSVCLKILEEQKFKISRNTEDLRTSLQTHKNTYQWLGEGIYFWHRNKERALFWAKSVSRRKGETAAAIKVPITYEEGSCFDLGKKENYKVIIELINKFIQHDYSDIDLDSLSRDDKFKFVGAVCDFLYQKDDMKNKYKLIFASFTIKKDEHNIIDEYTPQICVKDDEIIEYNKIEIIY